MTQCLEAGHRSREPVSRPGWHDSVVRAQPAHQRVAGSIPGQGRARVLCGRSVCVSINVSLSPLPAHVSAPGGEHLIPGLPRRLPLDTVAAEHGSRAVIFRACVLISGRFWLEKGVPLHQPRPWPPPALGVATQVLLLLPVTMCSVLGVEAESSTRNGGGGQLSRMNYAGVDIA